MKKQILTGIFCFVAGVLVGMALFALLQGREVQPEETLPTVTEAPTEPTVVEMTEPAPETVAPTEEMEAPTEETQAPTKPSATTPPATTAPPETPAPTETTAPSETTEPITPDQGEDELPLVPA